MAPKSMLRDGYDLMTCEHCRQPVILTVESGLCPRCFYKFECAAICAAAEFEVDRVLTETGALDAAEGPPTEAPSYAAAEPEAAWSW